MGKGRNNGDVGDVDNVLLLSLARGKLLNTDPTKDADEHSLDHSKTSSSTVSSEDNQQDYAVVVKPRMVLRRSLDSSSNLMNDDDDDGGNDKINQPPTTASTKAKKLRRRNSFSNLMSSAMDTYNGDDINKYGYDDCYGSSNDVNSSNNNRPRRMIRRRNSFSNLMESALKSAIKKTTTTKRRKNTTRGGSHDDDEDYAMCFIDNHADIWDDNNTFDSFSDMQVSQRELEGILTGNSSIPTIEQGLITSTTTTTYQLNCVDTSVLPTSNCTSSDDDDGDDDDDSIDIYIEGDDDGAADKDEKGEAIKKTKMKKTKSKKEKKEKKSKTTTEKKKTKSKYKEGGDKKKKRMKVVGSASDSNLMGGISVEDLVDRKEKRKKKTKAKKEEKNMKTMKSLKKSSSLSNLFADSNDEGICDKNGAKHDIAVTKNSKKNGMEDLESDFQQRLSASDSNLLWNAVDDDDDDSIKAITSKRKTVNSCSNSTTMLSKANRKKKPAQRRKIKYQSPRDIYGMSKTVQPKQPLPEFLLMSPKVDAFAYKDKKGQAFNALFNDDNGMIGEDITPHVAAVLNEVRDDYDDSSDEDDDKVPPASISHVTKTSKVVVSVIHKSSSTTSLAPYDIVCNERDALANERDSLQQQLNEEMLVNESLREEIQLLRNELNKSKKETIQEKDKNFLDRSTATIVANHRDTDDVNEALVSELTQQVQLLQNQVEEQKKATTAVVVSAAEEEAPAATDTRYQLGRLNGEVLQLKAKLNDRDETVASLKKKVNELIILKPLLIEKVEEDQEVHGHITKGLPHDVLDMTTNAEEDWKTKFICMQRQNEQLTNQMKHHAKEHETKMKDKEETISFLQDQLVKAMTDGGQQQLSSSTTSAMEKPRMKRRNSFTNLFMGED